MSPTGPNSAPEAPRESLVVTSTKCETWVKDPRLPANSTLMITGQGPKKKQDDGAGARVDTTPDGKTVVRLVASDGVSGVQNKGRGDLATRALLEVFAELGEELQGNPYDRFLDLCEKVEARIAKLKAEEEAAAGTSFPPDSCKTVAAYVEIVDDTLFAATLGDARVLVIGADGTLKWISADNNMPRPNDQTPAQFEAQLIREQDGAMRRRENTVRTLVGSGSNFYGTESIVTQQLKPGDMVFLLTDGAHRKLPSSSLFSVFKNAFAKNPDPDAALVAVHKMLMLNCGWQKGTDGNPDTWTLDQESFTLDNYTLEGYCHKMSFAEALSPKGPLTHLRGFYLALILTALAATGAAVWGNAVDYGSIPFPQEEAAPSEDCTSEELGCND